MIGDRTDDLKLFYRAISGDEQFRNPEARVALTQLRIRCEKRR